MIASSAQTDGRYAWSSIAHGARNYGNLMIEWSLRQGLDLPEPLLSFSSFRPIDPCVIDRINRECAFVLSPGCTTLQNGQNIGYNSFGAIRIPRPCFGGCLWQAGGGGVGSMLLKAIAPARLCRPLRRDGTVDLTIARLMSQPVGSRDPFTDRALRTAGIESRLLGCPTLLSAKPVCRWKPLKGRRLVVSLSRFSLPTQYRIIRRLARSWEVRLIIHENYERRIARLIRGATTVEYESPEQFMAEYRDADLVLTGRLHGALPAIRHGTPVIFYGDEGDTRFSLLSWLGLPIHKLSLALADLANSPGAGMSASVFDRAYELRRAFVEYARGYGIGTRITL